MSLFFLHITTQKTIKSINNIGRSTKKNAINPNVIKNWTEKKLSEIQSPFNSAPFRHIIRVF